MSAPDPRAPRPNNLDRTLRRTLVAGLAATPWLGHARGAGATGDLAPTAPQSLGPFYPRAAAERPGEIDNDLLRFDGTRLLTRGRPLYLAGRILDRRGQPQRDALVELWQCDANAVYHHPAGGAVAERDPHFQGYGQARTDEAGRFHFRTIEPVAYPGRTPHIHVRVVAAGRSPLGTQLYLAGNAGNARDFLFRTLDPREQAALSLTLRPSKEAEHTLARGTVLSAAVDLVLT